MVVAAIVVVIAVRAQGNARRSEDQRRRVGTLREAIAYLSVQGIRVSGSCLRLMRTTLDSGLGLVMSVCSLVLL